MGKNIHIIVLIVLYIKVSIEKLKNPFYRLHYLKKYAYRNICKKPNEIYNDFLKKY